MLPDESLQSLMNRVNQAAISIQNLHPSPFTLTQMDEELTCMAMIRALPQEYSSFVSATLLLTDLDKEKLQSAFITEEAQRRHRESSDMALASRQAPPSSSHTQT